MQEDTVFVWNNFFKKFIKQNAEITKTSVLSNY